MFGIDAVVAGILLVILALLLIGIALIVIRSVPGFKPPNQSPIVFPTIQQLQSNQDAVLLVQIGGRVLYSNPQAKAWFGFIEEEPNLERLARRTRPSDVFLSLCATEGQARFSVNGRYVEGTSYYIPEANGSSGAYLISCRHPEITTVSDGQTVISEHALDIFAELSQTMAASLDLEKTIQAILESVERLIPSDYAEITLWEDGNQYLIPYYFSGISGIDRRLEQSTARYKSGEGYSGYLIEQRQMLSVDDVDGYRKIRPAVDRARYPYRSYLGIPLLVAGELVGTLELASLSPQAFSESDQEALRILARQAAISLNNARLFQQEQDRILELSGLASLAQAVGSISDTHDLYRQLVEHIAPLIKVEVIGFVIYDEVHHNLTAQVPFIGIPADVLDFYVVTIPPDSLAEEEWDKQEVIVAENSPEDARLKILGVAHIALAASLNRTVLIPLTSGSHRLGYLQVADKIDDTPFDQDELRLLTIIASQSAIIIENASLVRQSQDRAQRSEALRRIASLSGSLATLDEILAFSMQEIFRLLRTDFAAIFLIDENQAELRLHQESLFGATIETTSRLGRISLTEPDFYHTVTGSQKTYSADDVVIDLTLIPFYRNLTGAFQLRSVMIIPLIVRNRGIGEILLGNREPGFFDENDLGLMATSASQLAAAIEKSRLYAQTDESLQRRVEQLLALTHVSQKLNTSLNLEQLIRVIYDELLRTSQADCGSIFYFNYGLNPIRKQTVTISVGDPREVELLFVEQHVVQSGMPIIVDDYSQALTWLGDQQLDPPHAEIKSSLVVPIFYQEDIAGMIHMHSRRLDCFDQTAIEIAQSLAAQASLALANSLRYREQVMRTESLNRRVKVVNNLLEASHELTPNQPLEKALEAIAYGIQESTPFRIVLISTYNEESGTLLRVTGVGLPLETMDSIRQRSQPLWANVRKLLTDEYKLSRSYFIPFDRKPYIPPELHLDVTLPIEFGYETRHYTWQREDLLIIPLYGSGKNLLGVISVDSPRNGLRPDRPTIEALEIFATQAEITIESHQELLEFKAKAQDMEIELERAIQAAETAQAHLPSLLHNELEQTLAIHRLRKQVTRIGAGMDLVEIVNRLQDRSDVMQALGQEMIFHMEMDNVVTAETSAGSPRLLHALGILPTSNVSLEALLGQRNPLRTCLQNGQPIFCSNLDGIDEWRNAALLMALEAKSFVCIPIIVDGEVDAALLATSHHPLSSITSEDEQIFLLMARQVAFALENIRLINETGHRLQEVNLLLDFSRKLGTLDPKNIFQTLVESALQAIPSANAVMAALWQPEQQSLVPQAAAGFSDNQTILEISYRSGQALPGQSFEQGTPLRINEVDFARQYNLPSEYLLMYQKATGGRLPVSSLITPLQTGDITLGVLVLDNYQFSGAFSEEHEALAGSLAHQTALALENARLFQSSEQRAAQLEAFTRVAGTITARLQSDELIDSLLDQVMTILPYDTGTLWLRQGKQMTIKAVRGFEDSEQRVGISLAIEDSLLLKEMIATNKPILVGDVRNDPRFPAITEQRYFSWLGVPLLSHGEVEGVVALEKAEANYYTPEHVRAMITFSGQAAVALANASLYEDSLRRATDLDERSQRLALLNRLSIALSGSLDLDYILQAAIEELKLAINCTAVSALMFDDDHFVYLQAESPQVAIQLPMLLPNSELFEHLDQSKGIFTTEDALEESMLAGMRDFLLERNTRGLLVLPLITGNDLHGLLLVQANQPYRFTSDETELGRTISNQVAVAIQNARLFAETQRLFAETRQRTAELATMFDMGVNITQVLDRRRLVDIIFDNTLRLLQSDSVALVLVSDEEKLTIEALDRNVHIGPADIPRSGTSFSEVVLETGRPLLIHDVEKERERLPAPGLTVGDPVESWLGVPLVVRGILVGVLSVQGYTPNAFGEAHLRLLSQVGNQLGVALDNARLFETVQNYTSELEKRVSERTKELEGEHQRIQTLLKIITELSASLDLDQVLTRTLAVVNESVSAEHSLIMLYRPEDACLYLRASLGYVGPPPKGGQTTSIRRNEGLAGWVLSNRQPALIPDLQDDPRWKRSDYPSQHRSALAVPLIIGEEILGVLLLYHRQPNSFSSDQLELVQATAKQISVAINNAQLYHLIRDQAERLGDMLRMQHVETSRSHAILEAVADGVLVTDAQRVITLFNVSAEKILQMKRSHVVGRSLDQFFGLFGRTAHSWAETIRKWSDDPNASQADDIYSEQITLDDQRVVSVNLSPVHLRNDFLGTVSIFRDITHLVEVDRLKSEFVATVSHELRTPMTSIKGYVEIMLMGASGELNSQQVHFLQVVKQNTERLAVLVNDLLDISRIEAGKAAMAMQALNLGEIVRESLNMLSRRMVEENRSMHVEVNVPKDLPLVYGDIERVRQILDNLVENSYQYTPEGGRIWITMSHNEKEVQVDVHDNGIGISPLDQPRVFERFYRGEDPLVLASSGTGLGLSIVKHLIDMHKGRIWVESSGLPGEGSTFSFTLPVFHRENRDEPIDFMDEIS